MNSLQRTCSVPFNLANKQRGAVLFIAIIALVTIMIAAAALMRSVDTATIISGNLAFKQAATASGDAGLEGAIAWLAAADKDNAAKKVTTDATHAFNVSSPASGYYSNADPALILTADATWTAAASASAGTDASGNALRYVVQRMCRNANQVLAIDNCLFSDAKAEGDSDLEIAPAKQGPRPLYRVTVRATGPRNTVSYIQAFVY